MATLDDPTDKRVVIMGWLMGLANALGEFEQTTHGLIGTPNFADICQYLRTMYQNPSAYNISNFTQAVDLWFMDGAKVGESERRNFVQSIPNR